MFGATLETLMQTAATSIDASQVVELTHVGSIGQAFDDLPCSSPLVVWSALRWPFMHGVNSIAWCVDLETFSLGPRRTSKGREPEYVNHSNTRQAKTLHQKLLETSSHSVETTVGTSGAAKTPLATTEVMLL